MSLINDALKKAQKVRTGDPSAIVPPMPGGTSTVEKLTQPRSTQQIVLIAAGALVLVVLSVVVTFWFVNRGPAAVPAPVPKAAVVKSMPTSAPPPTIVTPALQPSPASEKPVTTAAARVEPAKPSPAPARTDPVVTAITPPATADSTPIAASPADQAAPLAEGPTEPRIHAFVDAIKVMGIRSSGGDSRVLMNDRVYRVNDIVERTLGVRLIKVAPDSLTFSDSNGGVYVKNF